MRGLFKNQANITLFTVKIRDAYYEPDKKWLCFDTEDSDHIIIPYTTHAEAKQFIRDLYETGKTDFSHKLAYFNVDPPIFSGSV